MRRPLRPAPEGASPRRHRGERVRAASSPPAGSEAEPEPRAAARPPPRAEMDPRDAVGAGEPQRETWAQPRLPAGTMRRRPGVAPRPGEAAPEGPAARPPEVERAAAAIAALPPSGTEAEGRARSPRADPARRAPPRQNYRNRSMRRRRCPGRDPGPRPRRSEEHTSELQSRENLVCRLLLEKKKIHAI